MPVEHFQRAKPPYDPFALALAIIMRYFRFIEAQRIEVDHAVIMTERETGRGAVAYSAGQAPKAVSPENLDLTFMNWIEGKAAKGRLYCSLLGQAGCLPDYGTSAFRSAKRRLVDCMIC
jgi:hypothetical protein